MSTPARKQYLRIKKQHQDEVLLFRMGDFYETFDNDARLISRELEIALTSREMGKGERVPLAGIPYHALDGYLAKLIKKGYRVAICEQTSDPAASRGIVDREVVRVVTPGTVIEDSVLDRKANNYLAAVVTGGDRAGLAYVDITTSEFATSEFLASHLAVELAGLEAAELLVAEGDLPLDTGDGRTGGEDNGSITTVSADMFNEDWARERPSTTPSGSRLWRVSGASACRWRSGPPGPSSGTSKTTEAALSDSWTHCTPTPQSRTWSWTRKLAATSNSSRADAGAETPGRRCLRCLTAPRPRWGRVNFAAG